MASTNKTPNYDLPQWVETDPVEMADFNQAMSDIDSNLNLVQSGLGVKTITNWNNVFDFSDGLISLYSATGSSNNPESADNGSYLGYQVKYAQFCMQFAIRRNASVTNAWIRHSQYGSSGFTPWKQL